MTGGREDKKGKCIMEGNWTREIKMIAWRMKGKKSEEKKKQIYRMVIVYDGRKDKKRNG